MNFSLQIDDFTINSNEVFSYWFRRSFISLGPTIKESEVQNDFTNYLKNFMKSEQSSISSFLDSAIRKNNISLDSKVNSFPNKLSMYMIAVKVGLKVPEFLVTGNKSDLLKFSKSKNLIIVKPINTTFYFKSSNTRYLYHTEIVSETDIAKKEEQFGLSFFQEYIEKKIEIRTFILKDKIFSMAIFSQRDAQTKIDFRNYNYQKNNRTVPFKLPSSVEKKLLNLMQQLKYDSASIDLIYSKFGDFYFLEANPFGQFGMVSQPCNYFIEKEIAHYLIGKY